MTTSKRNLGVAAVLGALTLGGLACAGSTTAATGPGYLNPVRLANAIQGRLNAGYAQQVAQGKQGPDYCYPPGLTAHPEDPPLCVPTVLPIDPQSSADSVTCTPAGAADTASGRVEKFTCTVTLTLDYADGRAVRTHMSDPAVVLLPDGNRWQAEK